MSLKGEKVRIVCIKSYEEEPLDVIRGTVTDEWTTGLKVSGRHCQKIMEESLGRMIERPVDEETKVLFVPFSSIKFCEIIVEGSKSDMIDRQVKMGKPLTGSELKKGGSI